jgi:cbb3-type cytochrome oxidase maturation protein
MSAIYLLLPLSLLVATGFLAAFIWAVRTGQYEDTETPAMRVLMDEPPRSPLFPSTPRSQHSTSIHERRDH